MAVLTYRDRLRLEIEQAQADVARAELTLGDELGLAMRATRRRLRVSQRQFASAMGWSQSRVARLETKAGSLGIDVVIEALGASNFRLGVQVDERLEVLDRLADVVSWVASSLDRSGKSTREVAKCANVSQRTVVRTTMMDELSVVKLDTLLSVVSACGGRLRLVWDDARVDRLIDRTEWPTAAVVPLVRGGQRRLAAHGWLRATPWGGPRWYFERFYPRDDYSGPPLWTSEWPREPRVAEPGIEPLTLWRHCP